MANSMLEKPLVCETDVCHAIMCRLAWAVTGEPGVILDINNPGWDSRVFNVFHCSQTPPEWIEGKAQMANQEIIEGDAAVGAGNAFGTVGGEMIAAPFTGISAATTSDAFKATVFQGQLLSEKVKSFGANGWAYTPNLQEVLDEIHKHGIHHFVMMKGHHGAEVAKILAARGLQVSDCTQDVPSLADIEKELGPVPESGRSVCAVHSR
jgi:L-fucose isomerase-like protein